jgi:hypothetical protein
MRYSKQPEGMELENLSPSSEEVNIVNEIHISLMQRGKVADHMQWIEENASSVRSVLDENPHLVREFPQHPEETIVQIENLLSEKKLH